MSENKTQPTNADPIKFINSVEHKTRKTDALTLLDLFHDVTGQPPVMWGDSLIGFGQYHYKYASGREGDFLKSGFSPRKSNLALYLMTGAKKRPDLLAKLGPHKTGVACLYITQLSKIDMDVLRQLITADFQDMTEIYG